MSYYNRREYTLETDSPQHYSRNVANMPIFEDVSELHNRSSRNFSSEQHASSEQFGPVSSTRPNSSALKALQDYGSAFSTDILGSVKPKHDTEKQSKDANSFGSLNLNSVDEEDEFLYGDSNSLPEEPKSLLNCSEASINKNNSGWSDEDDFLGESPVPQTNIKSNVKKNPVIVQNEKILPEVSKKSFDLDPSSARAGRMFSGKKNSDNREIVHSTRSPVKIKDHDVSPYSKSINVVEKNLYNDTILPEVSATGTKSKYHAAAQILKKQTEKHDLRNKLNSSSNREFLSLDHSVMKRQEHPRIELSSKLTGKRTVFLSKSIHNSKEKEPSSNSMTTNLVESQRRNPKTFQPKELDNIKNILKESSKTYDSSSREHLHELRSSLKHCKDISPGRRISPSYESVRAHAQDNIKHILKDSRHYDSSSREHLHDLRSSLKSCKDISPERHRSPSYESIRVHARRTSHSPSLEIPVVLSKHRSPYTSRHRSPDHKYKHRSPPHDLRHNSPLGDSDRILYDYSSRHYSVHDRHRRYSRSPIRRSREKSPGYNKRRKRSPSRTREKSKSPMYHRSRDHSPKTKHLKTAEDKIKKTSYDRTVSSKKDAPKSRGSSSSSFCSLSFESHSLSSDSLSEENAHEKKESKKSRKSTFKDKRKVKSASPKREKVDKVIVKSPDIIPLKCENKSENVGAVVQSNIQNKSSEKQDDSDLFKNLSAEDKKFYDVVNGVFQGADIFNALIKAQQSGMDYAENPIPTSETEDSIQLPNSAMPFSNEDVSNTLAATNHPLPEIPFPQLFSFNPSLHPMPTPYPPVNSYPPLMPSPMLSPHVPAPPYYNPYAVPEMNVEMNFPPPKEPKHVHKKRPPVTLRSIPVSDNFTIARTAPALINIQPSLTKFLPAPSDSSPGKKKIDIKEKSSKTQLIALKESKVKESSSKIEENKSLLESYKKLKLERHLAKNKLNRVTSDALEMSEMVKQAWEKKNIDEQDKTRYVKCQDIYKTSTDIMRHYIREAKRLDGELNKVKEKLPKELLPEILKPTTEDHITEPQITPDITYILFDSGKQVCSYCYKVFQDIRSMMEHLQSSEHKQKAASDDGWVKDFRKKISNEKNNIDKEANLQPTAGFEFMKPTSGYFCTLCKEHSIDHIEAEQHLKSSEHSVKYKNYTKDNPLYENKCTVKKYFNQSVAIKVIKDKRKRETEEKEVQLAKRRKEETAADEKVKEMIKDQQSKEKNVEELEETYADNLTSNNAKLSGIKLTLSGDSSENKSKEKPVQKVVYIGRAPNYKAAAKKSRPLPWYKRDSQSGKAGSDEVSSNVDIVKKLKEKIALKSTPAVSSSVDVEKNSEGKKSIPLAEVPPAAKSPVDTTKNPKETNSTLPRGTQSPNKSLSSKAIKGKMPSGVPTSTNVSSSLEYTNRLFGKLIPAANKHPKATTPHKEIASTCLNEIESKNLGDKIVKNKDIYGPLYKVDSAGISEQKVKTTASSTSNIQNITKASKITDASSLAKDSIRSQESKKGTESVNPIVNQALKNILYGTDSTAHQDISLTEIKLPEVSKIADSSEEPLMVETSVKEQTPKDISSVYQNISLSNSQLPAVTGISYPPPLTRVTISETTPMDISQVRDIQIEFPDISQPPPLLARESFIEPTPTDISLVKDFHIGFPDVSQPPPLLLRETMIEPTPIGFPDVFQPPPALSGKPIVTPPIRDNQIGFPDVYHPPPSLRDTINEPTHIRNFQNVSPQSRKYTEEEKDFLILGINKDDFMPLVVPVPPPMSAMPSSTYVRNVRHAEPFASFPHNIGPGQKEIHGSAIGTIDVIQNSTVFPQIKSPSFKKQIQKSNKNNLITISPEKNLYVPESKRLKFDKTLSNVESKNVQFGTTVSNVGENKKDKLPKLDREQLAPAKGEDSVKIICGDVKAVQRESCESDVEFVPVASKQLVAPEMVDCFENKIQKCESVLDIVANKTTFKMDMLQKSDTEQLPPLKLENNTRFECDKIKHKSAESEIKQDSSESKVKEFMIVPSEQFEVSQAVNISEKKNVVSRTEDNEKSDVVFVERTEEDQKNMLQKSGTEELAPVKLKNDMRTECEEIQQDFTGSEVKEFETPSETVNVFEKKNEESKIEGNDEKSDVYLATEQTEEDQKNMLQKSGTEQLPLKLKNDTRTECEEIKQDSTGSAVKEFETVLSETVNVPEKKKEESRTEDNEKSDDVVVEQLKNDKRTECEKIKQDSTGSEVKEFETVPSETVNVFEKKNEESKIEGNDEKSDVYLATEQTEENQKNMLQKSRSEQLPLKLKNDTRTECEEIKQDYTGSAVKEFETVLSETVNVSEKKNEESRTEDNEKSDDVVVEPTEEYQKNMLQKSNTEHLLPLKLKNDTRTECDEIKQDSNGSAVKEFKTVLSETVNVFEKKKEESRTEDNEKSDDVVVEQLKNDMRTECEKIKQDSTGTEVKEFGTVPSETVNVSEKENEESEIEGNNEKSDVDLAAEQTEEDQKIMLPPLKLKNDMRIECKEIQQDSTASEVKEFETVPSEIVDVSENKNEELKIEDNSHVDVAVEKMEEYEKGMLKESHTEQLPPFEIKNDMRLECDETKQKLAESEIKQKSIEFKIKEDSSQSEMTEFMTVLSKQHVVSETDVSKKKYEESQIEDNVKSDESKHDVTAERIEKDQTGKAETQVKEVEVENLALIAHDKSYDVPINKIKEFPGDNLQKPDVEHLGSLELENSMISDIVEITQNEVKEMLCDSEMEDLTFSSQNYVESEKVSFLEIEPVTSKISVTPKEVNISENEIPQTVDEIQKIEDQSLIASENMETVVSLCKSENMTLTASEDTTSKSSDLTTEIFFAEQFESHEVESNISSNCAEVLHDSKIEDLMFTSQMISMKAKNIDSGNHIKEADVGKLPLISSNKSNDLPVNKMEESLADNLKKSDIGHLESPEIENNMVSSCVEITKDEAKNVLCNSEIEDLTCSSQNYVDSEKESVLKNVFVSSEISATPERVSIAKKKIPQITDEIEKIDDQELIASESLCIDSVKKINRSVNIALPASEGPGASKSSDLVTEKTERDKLEKSDTELLISLEAENNITFNCDKVTEVLLASEMEDITLVSEMKCEMAENIDRGSQIKEEIQNLDPNSSDKLYDLPANKIKESLEHNLQKSAIGHLGYVEVTKNVVKKSLHDSEMEHLTCSSKNNIESENDSILEIAPVAFQISATPERVSISEKKIFHITDEIKKDQPLTASENVSVDSMCKSENMTLAASGNSAVEQSLHVSHNNTESEMQSNMELSLVTSDDSITSEKAVIEKKIEVEKTKVSQEKENSTLVTSENFAASKSSDVGIENEIKLEKVNVEELVSFKEENTLSSESMTVIKNKNENALKLECDEIEKKIDEPEKFLLLSSKNSMEPVCSADKSTLNISSSDTFIQVKDQHIKDNDVGELSLISMKHVFDSEESSIPDVSKSDKCSRDSKEDVQSIDNYIELPILEECQEERVIKQNICNSRTISSVNESLSNDLNISSQSVPALETMPVLTSENAAKRSNAIQHEQNNSVQQSDPPILESESLRSTRKVDEKPVINNESNTIQQDLSSKAFESAMSDQHMEQSSEVPPNCSSIDLKSNIKTERDSVSSESLTALTQEVFIVSENKIKQKSNEVLNSSQERLSGNNSLSLLDSLQKSVLQLSKMSDSNESIMEQDSGTAASLEMNRENFVNIPENASKLDKFCENSNMSSSENEPVSSEQKESYSKTDEIKILNFEAMDCSSDTIKTDKAAASSGIEAMDYSPVLETDETNKGLPETEKTTVEIIKSQEGMDFTPSLMSIENNSTKVSKKDAEGSDTDEYNEE